MKAERGPLSPLLTIGKRTIAGLISDVRTSSIDIVVRAQVVISVATATAIRNRGRAMALFSEMGITEGGKPVWQIDPRVLAFQTEQQSPSALTNTNLTALTVGTYNLVDRARFAFAHPYAIDPRETWYTERNPQVDFSFYAILPVVATALAGIVTAGAATVALPSLSINVQQNYDRYDKKLPIFLPQTEYISQVVTGATAKLEIPLKYTDRLRSITISQVNDLGEVTDIINTVGLRGDTNRWIEDVSLDDLARAAEYEQGGDVYVSAGGRHTYINFQTAGRLSNILSPATQDTNLRLVLNVQPSATGTVSTILVTLNKLVRDPFTGPDGRKVVDPSNQAFNLY